MAVLRTSVKDQVYEIIKTKILTQELKLGEPINIVHLCSELSTSNTPVREALTKLESEGLVTSAMNSKFRVISFDENSLFEINSAILILLTGGFELCIKMGNLDSLTKLLHSALYEQEKLFSEIDSLSYIAAAIEFDRSFIVASTNKRLLRIFDTLSNLLALSVVYNYNRQDHKYSNIEEHKAMLSAIESGNLSEVLKLLEHHYDKHIL